MTVSVVQTNDVAGAGNVGFNFASNVAIGNSILAWVCEYNSSGAAISSSAPTYNGASVTGASKLFEVQSTASGTTNIMYCAVWLLPNVQSSGTNVSFTVTNGNADANSHRYIAEVAGLGSAPAVDSASPNPATAFGDAGGTLTSGATGSAAASSGIAVGGMMQDGATTWTNPSGWTVLAQSFGGAGYQVFSASGSSYTWNPTSTGANQWAAGAVILDAPVAGTAAPGAPRPPLARPHPYALIRDEAQQRIDWASPGVADLTVAFSSTAGGIDTYNVTSPWDNYASAGAQQMRVLKPTSPNANYPPAFLIMLPVDPNQNTVFGDSIATAQTAGVHNTYNLTCVQPGYAPAGASGTGPWFGDNPLDSTISQEKYTLLVVSWIRQNLATTGTEKVYLIGFSRSGLAAQFLQFRHPYLFPAVASWDSPFGMTDYDGTDPNGAVGGNSSDVFGTSASFKTSYQLSAAYLANWQATGQYGVNRIWIGQGPAFTDTAGYDSALTTAGIPHTYTFSNTVESHAWHTDWVAAALASIIPSNWAQAATVLPQQYAGHPVFTRLLEVAAYRTDGTQGVTSSQAGAVPVVAPGAATVQAANW